jgi:hypothetical protein
MKYGIFGNTRRVLRAKESSKGAILVRWENTVKLSYLLGMLAMVTLLVSNYRSTEVDSIFSISSDLTKINQQRQQKEPLFHFIHTTNEASFHQRSLRAVESVFFHHPKATVLIHVPDDGHTIALKSDMTEQPFLRLIDAGYNVTVERFQLQTLLDAAISLEGVSSRVEKAPIDKWMKTQILPNMMKWSWYVDISDLVRLLVLYAQGGLYLDTDIIVVNPVTVLPNSFGFVRDGGPGSGVLKFDHPGNPFLADCINEYFKHFRSNTQAWGYVGPSLLKRVWKSKYRGCQIPNPPAPRIAAQATKNNGVLNDPLLTISNNTNPSCPFHILWQDVYYPNVDNCFVNTPNTKQKQKHIQENTFIAHTYNQRTKVALEKMNVTKMKEEDTLCNWLYSSFCIFCDEDVWKESEMKVTY